MRYTASLTAGGLKLPESRVIASLLLSHASKDDWERALYEDNVLQVRGQRTAERYCLLIRKRLKGVPHELLRLIHGGSTPVATHACLAAAVKESALLGDYLDLAVREHYRLFKPSLSRASWSHYIEACRARDPDVPEWAPSTVDRLRASVFQILAEAGYIESARTLRLQAAQISPDVIRVLRDQGESYVLRCIEVGP